MKPIKVKIKKLHKDAVIPQYAHDTDSGLDLTAVSKTYYEYGNVVYGFGLSFEIPEGYVWLILPRSSNHKHYLTLTNSVGVIDSGYRGEVTAKFSHNLCMVTTTRLSERIRHLIKGWLIQNSDTSVNVTRFSGQDYNVGDRVAQMIIIPYQKVEFEVAEELQKEEDLTAPEVGSMGQSKTVVNPLLPYYDKLSARVTDDLYNLGLTARKQAVKTEDPGKDKAANPMRDLLKEMRQ